MNLTLFETRDKLKGTLDMMLFTKTKEDLNKLLSKAIQELLDYQLVLKKDIENN